MPKQWDVGGAEFSNDRVYRYVLWRRWQPEFGEPDRRCVFIGLNPSTADEKTDDPTIRRCLGFARMFACNELIMLNLHALISTDPKGLRGHADPTGPLNDAAWSKYVRPDSLVIAGWGNIGFNTCRRPYEWFKRNNIQAHCLGYCANDSPRHPLYLPSDAKLEPWPRVARLW